MKRYLITLIIVVCGTGQVFSQGQITLYQMQNSLPQANFVNPAFRPDSKITIGLPIISSLYLSFDTPVSVDEVLVAGSSGDSLKFSTSAILESLNENNKIDLAGSASLLYLGFNMKKGFLSIGFNTRLNGAFAYPGDALALIIEGPGDETIIKLEEFNLRASLFNEFAIGYNRDITNKLVVGVKVKYLQGIANIDLENFNGTISSNIDSIHISSNPWVLRTSGLDILSNNNDPGYFLFQNNNVGFAIDIGAQYAINDNLKVSASVLDLGSINWKEGTKQYEFDGVNYTFDGFDFLEIIKDDGDIDDSILDKELDSLKTIFDPEVIEGESYSTPLTGNFYLGATYTLLKMHTFGIVFNGVLFKSTLTPTLGLTYNLSIGKILDIGISASYRNNSFGNFGGGIAVKGGPVRVYFIGDNIESVFYPSRAKVVSLRAGLVLGFGKKPGDSF